MIINYFYYAIYCFYTKIIKVQKYDDPFFYCIAAISMLESLFLTSIYDLYLLFENEGMYFVTSKWIGISVVILLFGLNWLIFKKKHSTIINKISKKSMRIRRFGNFISLIIITLIITLFIITGELIRTNNGF